MSGKLSSLKQSIQRGELHKVKVYMKGVDKNIARLHIVKYLVEEVKVDVNLKNYGETALHLSASRGLLEYCKYFLEKGVDKTITNKIGATAAEVSKTVEIRRTINAFTGPSKLQEKKRMEDDVGKLKDEIDEKRNELLQCVEEVKNICQKVVRISEEMEQKMEEWKEKVTAIHSKEDE